MSTKWNVETVIKEIRQQNKRAPINIKKNGEIVYIVWEGESPPEQITSQPVSSYNERVSHFLLFFRKSVWEINLQ